VTVRVYEVGSVSRHNIGISTYNTISFIVDVCVCVSVQVRAGPCGSVRVRAGPCKSVPVRAFLTGPCRSVQVRAFLCKVCARLIDADKTPVGIEAALFVCQCGHTERKDLPVCSVSQACLWPCAHRMRVTSSEQHIESMKCTLSHRRIEHTHFTI
jgi:hypothetical protein